MPIFSEAQLKNGQFDSDAAVPVAAKKGDTKKAAAPEKKGLAAIFAKKPTAKK